jgi:hypothetical protein
MGCEWPKKESVKEIAPEDDKLERMKPSERITRAVNQAFHDARIDGKDATETMDFVTERFEDFAMDELDRVDERLIRIEERLNELTGKV